MLDPSPGTTLEIKINGEAFTLWYGLRSWLELKVNPLKRIEFIRFIEDIDILKAAEIARAGTLWRYRPGEDLDGQTPKELDFFIDHMDVPKFAVLFREVFIVAGLSSGESTATDGGGNQEPPQDPPTA